MKVIVTTLALTLITLIGTTTEAEARSHSGRIYISGYRSCGTPIYSERYFIGYDHCGRPVWGARLVRQHYRPAIRRPYVAPCPSHRGAAVAYGRSPWNGGFSIQGSFRH